jgi:hypothetical protein
MPSSFVRRSAVVVLFLSGLILASSGPAEAQREWQPLFDKFSFKGELSWVGFETAIGLFEDDLGVGGVLNFENDLNLGSREFTPSLDFEWQIAKRHKVAGRWQQLNRSSSAQALTNIEWGDEVIPIDADISLAFDVGQFFVDYTFYPWVKERWAAGFGLGFRWMDLGTTLSWRLEGDEIIEDSQDADVSAPLPYIYFEYRRLLTEHWRMIIGVGWLDVTIGDVSGGQWVGRAGFEYLLGKRWSVGGAANVATIDVEADNISGDHELVNLRGTIEMDIWDLSLFGRVRF